MRSTLPEVPACPSSSRLSRPCPRGWKRRDRRDWQLSARGFPCPHPRERHCLVLTPPSHRCHRANGRAGTDPVCWEFQWQTPGNGYQRKGRQTTCREVSNGTRFTELRDARWVCPAVRVTSSAAPRAAAGQRVQCGTKHQRANLCSGDPLDPTQEQHVWWLTSVLPDWVHQLAE